MARDTPLGVPSHTLPYRYHKYTALPTVSDTPYGRAIRGVFSFFCKLALQPQLHLNMGNAVLQKFPRRLHKPVLLIQ